MYVPRDDFHLSVSRAEQLYSSLRGSAVFERVVRHMSSGPIVALILSKPAAIEAWRKVCGPEDPEQARNEKPNSLRARIGTGKKRLWRTYRAYGTGSEIHGGRGT